MRVNVKTGDATRNLGHGTVIRKIAVSMAVKGDLVIHFIKGEILASNEYLRKKETLDWVITTPEFVITEVETEVIKLDSGETVYGCQVWFAEII